MLKEAPNNNDVTRVEIAIVLKKTPNSNDATRVENDVRLTAMGAQQFQMEAI